MSTSKLLLPKPSNCQQSGAESPFGVLLQRSVAQAVEAIRRGWRRRAGTAGCTGPADDVLHGLHDDAAGGSPLEPVEERREIVRLMATEEQPLQIWWNNERHPAAAVLLGVGHRVLKR